MSSVLSMKRHVKRYRFADEMISMDVVISSILGILSVLGTISIVIYGIIKRGTALYTAGAVLLADLLAGLTALAFAILARKANEGSARSKRMAMWISIIAILLVGAVFLCSRF